MPHKLKVKDRCLVPLDFGGKDETPNQRQLDLSCIAQTGCHLWLGSDETVLVDRLTWDPKRRRFGQHTDFDLSKFFRLPAGADEEIDIEGMTVVSPYLWVVGSHSLTRGKVSGAGFEEAIADLTRIERESNRSFLARVPIVPCVDDAAQFELLRTAVDPQSPRSRISAARLFGTGATSVLADALRFDDLLRPYIDLPGKDNGLDIEGLAVDGERVFLGLRGPVLRGWAVMLELEPEYFCEDYFTLAPIGRKRRLYRRHFFDLSGLGIRDLLLVEDELWLLAGPTMDIDGRVLLLRWKGYGKRKKETVVPYDKLEVVLDFGGGDVGMRGKNHPEGITLFTPPEGCDLPAGVLVTYDCPAGEYVKGRQVQADLFPFST